MNRNTLLMQSKDKRKTSIEEKDIEKKEKRKEWSMCTAEELISSLCPILVRAKKAEIEKISAFIADKSEKNLYVYGMPGSGKTYTVRAIGAVLAEKELEVYYSNLQMDKCFKKIGNGCTETVLLIVDEFEGNKKSRIYIKQKDKLAKEIKDQKASTNIVNIVYKAIFISNEKYKEGIHFKPYTKEAVIEIIGSTGRVDDVKERILRIKEGVERADIRVSLQKKIRQVKKDPNNAEDLYNGHYHQFVKRKVSAEEVNVNIWYTEFISEMRKKSIPIISKELFKEIVDIYTEGIM